MEHILEPHQATMVERWQLVLAIQDTTTLNYGGLATTEGLVGLGGGGKGTRGLVAHVGLAVNAAGRPLGVFALDATFRDGEDKENEGERWLRGHGWSRSVTVRPMAGPCSEPPCRRVQGSSYARTAGSGGG